MRDPARKRSETVAYLDMWTVHINDGIPKARKGQRFG